ncbi:hypothetical protein FPZ54_02495 [Sphingomonas suaedae]|uniref:Uncharacterized protein n=1 Tax=Sphingomonas suaedae TaxID=2599297 RepID=A0A518RC22_9SPHN|nr:hypothetical protein [Sphingomonas suaedae]QDX25007.1 hypothetical protein FPZ54_02495 [Sphingomonas suaedae]
MDLTRLRATWTVLLQAATWLVALIMLFVLKPPRFTPADDGLMFVRAVEFVAAIALALGMVVIHRKRLRLKTLWTGCAVATVAAVTALFGYVALVAQWTCEYDGRGPVVIGSKILAEAKRYAATLSDPGCEVLIQDAAGDTASVWPQYEIVAHHLALTGCFMATVLLFALAALLAVETFRAGMGDAEVGEGA